MNSVKVIKSTFANIHNKVSARCPEVTGSVILLNARAVLDFISQREKIVIAILRNKSASYISFA